MTLGEQIKEAREHKNLSQEELAEYIGVSRQAISKWENNTAMPQGVNREVLAQVLEFDIASEETTKATHKQMLFAWMGWGCATLLLVLLLFIGLYQEQESDIMDESQTIESNVQKYIPTEDNGAGLMERVEEKISISEPALKMIRFYDKNQNEVTEEALWYNAAAMESILIQWEGGSPNSIQMFFVPSGTETLDQTQLLLTEPVLDGDTVELLSADALADISQGHIYFVLDFGQTIATSEIYNMFYDESILAE